MKKEEFALESYRNLQELIKFIDQKASLLLVITGAIIPIFLEISKNLFFIKPKRFIEILVLIFGVLVILTIACQLYFIVFRIIGVRKPKHYSSKEQSLFYYGHIIQKDKSDFMSKLNNLTDKAIMNEISSQVYEVAHIMDSKSENFRIASYLFLIEIVMFLIYVFLVKLL